MPIPIVCPSCAAKLRAPDTVAGRKTKCPKCGSAIAVPIALREVEEPARDDSFEFLASARRKPPVVPGGRGSRSGLWIGLGAAVFVLVLAVSGVILWATGSFSRPQKPERQSSEALSTRQSPPKSQ